MTSTSHPDRAEPQTDPRFAVLSQVESTGSLELEGSVSISYSSYPEPSLTIVPPGGPVRPPRWDVRDPAVQTRHNSDGSIWAYSYESGSERWMSVPGIASFRFGSHGGRVVAVPEPRTPPVSRATIEDAYHRAILPMALQAHGQEVVHASAVYVEDGVVAFSGRSQTGKSTLAYGMHRRGYRVWADDTLVFDASANPVRVIPYPHRLRIRAEAAAYFDLHELKRRDSSSWTALEQAQSEPAPLACVFLLERVAETSSPVETVRLTPAEAFSGVLEHAYWFRLDPERTRRMIGKYLALATQVPVFRLRFGTTLDHLPETLDQVQSVVRRVVTGR